MEKMKQSFARLVAWAKKHPWAAVGIVGAVVLVAWLVYRKSGNTGEDASVNQYGAGEGALGAGGGASAYEDLIPSSTTPAAITPSSPQPSEAGQYYSLPSSDYGTSSFADPSAFYSSYAAPTAALEPAPVSTPSSYDFGQAGIAPVGGLLSGLRAAASVPVAAGTYEPIGALVKTGGKTLAGIAAPITAPPITSGDYQLGNLGQIQPVGNLAAGLIAAASTPTTAAQPIGAQVKTGGKKLSDLNPAQRVGKGKNFSGTFRGVTYRAGFPVSTAAKTVTPSFGQAGNAPSGGLSDALKKSAGA